MKSNNNGKRKIDDLYRIESFLPIFPIEIITFILYFFDFKSLLRFREVCQGANQLISSPNFVNSWIKFNGYDLPEFDNKKYEIITFFKNNYSKIIDPIQEHCNLVNDFFDIIKSPNLRNKLFKIRGEKTLVVYDKIMIIQENISLLAHELSKTFDNQPKLKKLIDKSEKFTKNFKYTTKLNIDTKQTKNEDEFCHFCERDIEFGDFCEECNLSCCSYCMAFLRIQSESKGICLDCFDYKCKKCSKDLVKTKTYWSNNGIEFLPLCDKCKEIDYSDEEDLFD